MCRAGGVGHAGRMGWGKWGRRHTGMLTGGGNPHVIVVVAVVAVVAAAVVAVVVAVVVPPRRGLPHPNGVRPSRTGLRLMSWRVGGGVRVLFRVLLPPGCNYSKEPGTSRMLTSNSQMSKSGWQKQKNGTHELFL